MIQAIQRNGSEELEKSHTSTVEKPNLAGDWLNFYLLLILYIIQGIPIGLVGAFSMILQSKNTVTYEDQAMLSVAQWPFFMKILWAPIVDSFHIQWIGRRKSWLLSIQLLLGSLFLYIARNIDDWVPESGKPNLKMLTFVIFIVNFLSASQDIVVDGWSLTMLKKKNLNYAATSNSVGVPLGIFIGSVCFNLLVSEQFSREILKTTSSTGGIITMKKFFYILGIVVLLFTIIVGMFKREKDTRLDGGYANIDVLENYRLLWEVLKLPRIKILAVALFTSRIGVSAADIASTLKLIDAGVSKDNLMIIGAMVFAVEILTPIVFSRYVKSPKPMSYYLNITPGRLLMAASYAALVYYTPGLILKNGVVDVPIYYYCLLAFVIFINKTLHSFMLLNMYAFFCRLSDPRFGGTYMTLFNTIYYLGFLLSNTIVLKLISVLTFHNACSVDVNNSCSTLKSKNLCKTYGGSCDIIFDGYYIAMVVCMVIGFVWYGVFRNTLREYQLMDPSSWLENAKSKNIKKTNRLCSETSSA